MAQIKLDINVNEARRVGKTGTGLSQDQLNALKKEFSKPSFAKDFVTKGLEFSFFRSLANNITGKSEKVTGRGVSSTEEIGKNIAKHVERIQKKYPEPEIAGGVSYRFGPVQKQPTKRPIPQTPPGYSTIIEKLEGARRLDLSKPPSGSAASYNMAELERKFGISGRVLDISSAGQEPPPLSESLLLDFADAEADVVAPGLFAHTPTPPPTPARLPGATRRIAMRRMAAMQRAAARARNTMRARRMAKLTNLRIAERLKNAAIGIGSYFKGRAIAAASSLLGGASAVLRGGLQRLGFSEVAAATAMRVVAPAGAFYTATLAANAAVNRWRDVSIQRSKVMGDLAISETSHAALMAGDTVEYARQQQISKAIRNQSATWAENMRINPIVALSNKWKDMASYADLRMTVHNLASRIRGYSKWSLQADKQMFSTQYEAIERMMIADTVGGAVKGPDPWRAIKWWAVSTLMSKEWIDSLRHKYRLKYTIKEMESRIAYQAKREEAAASRYANLRLSFDDVQQDRVNRWVSDQIYPKRAPVIGEYWVPPVGA